MELVHQPEEIISERYRIIDTLGQGGSGITYLAEDLQSGERVALKALSLRRMTDWKMMELFEREVKILSQINHPRIPHYLEYFEIDRESDRSFYIVQQLVEGKSLAAWVESGWRTDENGVQQIAIQLLNILVYLQNLKPPVIHRDIKPQNIIRRTDGQIFLVDFGAVQDTYHNTVTGGSTVVGTYGYMAPEQFRGQAVPTTDLYGLGATLLFLLTHRSPGDLPTDRLKINFRSRVQISAHFADWLEKMLEPDVEDRFPSAKEALAALQGKRSISDKDKVSQTFRRQALVGLGVAGVVSVCLFDYYKYPLLNYFGIRPAPVFEATFNRDIDAVRHYLERGGNVNAKDKDGHTLMNLVLESRHKEVAELLIAKGADVNSKNNSGDTLLHLVLIENLNLKDVDVAERAERLIAKGADVNSKNKDGKTPLYFALIHTSKDVVERLIAKGADVNAKNNSGDTPLHWVLSYYRKDMAELLIAKGADVNSKNNSGATPLHSAARSDNLKDVAELLIAKGADVNAKNNSGATPLHLALSRQDSTRAAELLIAKGADVNSKNNNGDTPLHLALRNNLKDMAELLIAKGVDVNSKNNNGDTPLHSAARSDNLKDMAELLIAKGADVNAKNNNGDTLLRLAVKMNNNNVVELLKNHGGKK